MWVTGGFRLIQWFPNIFLLSCGRVSLQSLATLTHTAAGGSALIVCIRKLLEKVQKYGQN